MAARVVRKAWNVVMVGADNHGGLYYYNVFTGLGTAPGPPVPYPPGLSPLPPWSFHVVLTFSAWFMGEHKVNTTVLVEGDPIVSKGHEAKHDVHIPPGINLLLPVTLCYSASKWVLGVGSVLAKEGPVASTMFGPVGANYNCQDPCAFPFPNVMTASSSVQVAPTGTDWGVALLEMAIQSAIEFGIAYGLEHPPEVMKRLVGKLISSALGKRSLNGFGSWLGSVGRWVGGKYGKIPFPVKEAGQAASKKYGPGNLREAFENKAKKNLLDHVKVMGRKAADAKAEAIAENQAKGLGKEEVKKAGEKAWSQVWKKGTEEISEKRLKPAPEVTQDWIKGASGDVVKDGVNRTGLAEGVHKRLTSGEPGPGSGGS